jgi:hypothetical protein
MQGRNRQALVRAVGLVWAMAMPLIVGAQSAESLARQMLQACSGRASCAEADFYSGSFEWSENITADIGSSDNRSQSNRTMSITMVVTAGRVECRGGMTEQSQRWSSGMKVQDRQELGNIDGAGLIRIEFGRGGVHSVGSEDVELADDVPSYNIAVVCPSPTSTVTGDGERTITPGQPAGWGSSWEIQTYDCAGDFSQRSLSGSSTWNHPEADPVNGITGSVTVKWNLTKR